MPAMDEAEQVLRSVRIDGGEGFVQQNHRAVLQQGAGEEGALELPGGEAPDRALLEARQPHGLQGLGRGRAHRRADAAEDADPAPVAKLDHVEDRDRKAAIDVGLLRQVGDLGAPDRAEIDAAGERPQQPDDGLQQRGLAGTVGADDGGERARAEAAADVMDRGMAVIAEGEIIEADGGGAHDHQSRAQPTAAHSASMMQRIPARRPSALCPNSVGESLRSMKPDLANCDAFPDDDHEVDTLWYIITYSVKTKPPGRRWPASTSGTRRRARRPGG